MRLVKRLYSIQYVLLAVVLLSTLLVALAAWHVHSQDDLQPAAQKATLPVVVSDTKITNRKLNSALYEWRDFRNLQTPDYAAKLDTLSKQGFNTIFVSVDAYNPVGSPELNTGLLQMLDAYRQLCAQHGFTVQALAGDKDWSLPDKRYRLQDMVAGVAAYNAAYPDRKITQLQFDVESYNLPEYTANRQQILQYFMQTVSSAMQQAQVNGFAAGFALPFWFDEAGENVESLNFNGKTAYPTQHVLDTAQQYGGFVVIMAYRTQLDGEDGIVAHTKTELAYARSKPNASIYIAQEVSNVEPAKITYYSQGIGPLLRNINLLNQTTQANYKGVVVNDLASM